MDTRAAHTLEPRAAVSPEALADTLRFLAAVD
jgi:hypothetical protein